MRGGFKLSQSVGNSHEACSPIPWHVSSPKYMGTEVSSRPRVRVMESPRAEAHEFPENPGPSSCASHRMAGGTFKLKLLLVARRLSAVELIRDYIGQIST